MRQVICNNRRDKMGVDDSVCPYRAIGGNECAHRFCWKERRTKKNKSICRYKNSKECSLYKEWLEKRKIRNI